MYDSSYLRMILLFIFPPSSLASMNRITIQSKFIMYVLKEFIRAYLDANNESNDEIYRKKLRRLRATPINYIICICPKQSKEHQDFK
jgi:hypothetical protein